MNWPPKKTCDGKVPTTFVYEVQNIVGFFLSLYGFVSLTRDMSIKVQGIETLKIFTKRKLIITQIPHNLRQVK